MSTATDRPRAGEAPRGPERLSLGEWRSVAGRAVREFLADDCLGLAQQVAYSSVLAFFPAMIFLVGLLGLLGVYEQLQEFLAVIAPDAVLDALEIAQSSAEEPALASLAFVLGGAGAMWAASGAMGSVVKAVNRAYDRTDTRPFWKKRLLAMALVGGLVVVTVGLFVLIVFGGPIGEAIADHAGLGGAFGLVWGILRWPIMLLAILLFFAAVYYAAPDADQRSWKWLSPGAVVGSILWLLLSALFALYTSFAGAYDETYGSLASGIVLLLWLNYSALALLLGAELNAEADRQADIRAAGGENAGLVKPVRRVR